MLPLISSLAKIGQLILTRSAATRCVRRKPVSNVYCRLRSWPQFGRSTISVMLVVLFVRPIDFWHNVNPQYADFPNLSDHRGADHKGAAEYVLAQDFNSDDLVIAVDAQQQGYYLDGRLDYYLRSLNEIRNSSVIRDGKMINLYTGTPQISSGDDLAKVFGEQNRGQILIIGSGEIAKNPSRNMGNGIWETMQDFGVDEVYEGRDSATKVWRYSNVATDDE